MPSEAEEKLQYLIKLIEIDMEGGYYSGGILKEKARKTKLTIVIVSALVTMALGLNLGDTGKNAAIILSAILTAVNTWDAFCNYHQRSIQEVTNVNKLSLLHKEILLYLKGNNNCEIEKYEEYKRKYDNIHEEYMLERNGEKEEVHNDGKK